MLGVQLLLSTSIGHGRNAVDVETDPDSLFWIQFDSRVFTARSCRPARRHSRLMLLPYVRYGIARLLNIRGLLGVSSCHRGSRRLHLR